MKTWSLAFLALAAWIGLAGSPVAAQTPDAAAEHKKARDEFVQAEQTAQKRQVSVESFQRELGKLVEQKNHWQSEALYAKGKVAFANEKLKYYTTLGTQREIEKWRMEVENWSARSKTAEAEMTKGDSDIQATVQALQTSLQQSDEGSLLLPDENIELFVTEDDTLNGVYQIRRGGYIILPRVGRVALAGKNLATAEKAIKEALGQNQIKDATVLVERPQGGTARDGVAGDGQVIYLTGEFLKPGVLKIPHGVSPTIVTAIARSGGTTPAADLTKVRLLRLVSGQALVEEVNVQAILSGAGLPSDLTLNFGDIIMVPAFANVVYVTGNVQTPGPMKLLPDDELTAYSAILRAGGFARFANRKKVYVLRDEGNGTKKKIPVNIKDIQSGGNTDVILQSKDIVVVPEKFFSF